MMNREYNESRENHESYYISNGDETKDADNNDGWQELIDPQSGAHFYWNQYSGKTTWDPPIRFQAGQVDHQTAQVAKPVGFSEVYAALLDMGFPPESIVAEMNEAQGNISYDDLVAKLSVVHEYDSDDVDAAIPESTNQTTADYLIRFAKEIVSSGEESSHELLNSAAMDLSAKVHMAISVLKTFDEDDDSSEQVINLISWAKEMKQFHSDLVHAFDENIPFELMTEHYGAGLIAWYNDLEVTRSTVDENCVSSNVISDKELRRIAELNEIAGQLVDYVYCLNYFNMFCLNFL